MYTGMWKPFKVHRPLTFEEQQERFVIHVDKKRRKNHVEPDERNALIRLNSTYADFIDRWYLMRGGMMTFLGGAAFLVPLLGGGMLLYAPYVHREWYSLSESLFCVFGALVVFCMALGIWNRGLKSDFLCYTHYPVRFNRQTRTVHAFVHNGSDGVISVPWNEAYFHIGRSVYDKGLYDLRCHVMEGNMVKHTFTVGGFSDNTRPVEELWQFIRTYMEDGPVALQGMLPIGVAVGTDFKNTFIWANIFCQVMLPIPILNWLIVPPVLLTRWLVMKSCKIPQWPAEVLAESVIEESDPFCWAEPVTTGAFAQEEKVWEAVKQHAANRHSRTVANQTRELKSKQAVTESFSIDSPPKKETLEVEDAWKKVQVRAADREKLK